MTIAFVLDEEMVFGILVGISYTFPDHYRVIVGTEIWHVRKDQMLNLGG